MPAGYNSQPISGFTGHMPGAKWQVGRRYVPPDVKKEDLVPISSVEGPPPQPFVENGVQSEMSFRQDLVDQGVSYINGAANDLNAAARSQASFLSPTSSNYSVGFDAQGRPMRVPQNFQQQGGYAQGQQQYQAHGAHGYQTAGVNYGDGRISYPNYENDGRNMQQQHQQYGYTTQGNVQITEFPSQTGHRSRAEMSSTSASGRSKSLPRNKRIEKDPFEGVESGWWSKGEVLRNKERREMAEKGKTVSGGDWSAPKVDVSPPRKTWKEREDELNDIPTAGYSGHIPQLRQIGVGKPFHRAAKEAKEQYVERRRALSGGREQFYSNGSVHFDGGGSEQLNYAHSVAPGMHTRSAF